MSNSQIVNATGRLLSAQDDAMRALLQSSSLSQADRHIRFYVGPQDGPLREVLYAQHLEVHEEINADAPLRLTVLCVSTRSELRSDMLVGQPIEVQVLNDQGQWRSFMGVVSQAVPGQSDGSLYTWLIEGIDALSLMQGGCNSRAYLNQSVVDITRQLLAEWRQRSPALARAFEFITDGLHAERYPARQFTLQWNESDAAFLIRLWRKHGISWVVRPGAARADNSADSTAQAAPCHTLALFDDGMALPANAAGSLRYHHDGLPLGRNAVTLWSPVLTVVPGRVGSASWDYKAQRPTDFEAPLSAELGQAGQALAQAILDYRIEAPHWADNAADFEHLGDLRVQRQAFEAAQVNGASGARDMSAGTWVSVVGLPGQNDLEPQEAEHIIAAVRHFAQNNLPKTLDERATGLFAASGWQGDRPLIGVDEGNRRYGNTFTAVQRATPVVPAFDPKLHWPVMRAMSAIVVGPSGQEVHCDELGRIKIRIPGLRMVDHEHAQGAGTSDSDRDSAWVRQASPWASNTFGALHLPRIGDEVVLDWLGGDPDKPMITGSVYSPYKAPPTFSHQGSLPGNKYLSGTKSKEVFGQRSSEVLLDATPDQIGVRISSDHDHTQIGAGYLAHPRRDGVGEPRGEGLEMRTDGAAALRAGQGVLVSAEPQPEARGSWLERDALIGLAEVLQGVQHALGDSSEKHQADGTDHDKLQQIIDQLKGWDVGSNIRKNDSAPGRAQAPMVAVSAPAGIVLGSQDNLTLGAQTDIDVVSVGHTQVSAGKRLLMRCADTLSAFAQKGIKLVAAMGNIRIQANQQDIELTAAKRIVLTAGQEIVLQAPIIRQISQGAQVQVGSGSIIQQSSGAHVIKSSTFSHAGPGGGSPAAVNLPSGLGAHSQHLQLRDGVTGEALPGQRYRITTQDGKVTEGVSDAGGLTSLMQSEVAFGRYTIEVLGH
jgi:type VI secretion system secreted protein VgrG